MEVTLNVNLLAVFVAAITSMVVGGFWYSPLLFGNVWMKLSGVNEKQVEEAKKKGMAKNYVGTFIGCLVMALVLANFVAGSTVFEGLQTGFWLWLGFIATVMLSTILWEGKTVKLYLLKVLHELVTVLIMTAILSAWH